MKTLALLVLVSSAIVIVASLPLEADDDGSLLDRLGRETVRITRSADEHRVTVVMGGSQTHSGVLMGSRPWVVVPFGGTPVASTGEVVFHDGTRSKAERVFGNAEVGVAVYALADETKGRTGLDVHSAWDLERGQLVVTGSGATSLALIDGVDRVTGRVRAGDTPPGALLLDTRGRVVGLGGTAGMPRCTACHTPAAAATTFVSNWTNAGDRTRVASGEQQPTIYLSPGTVRVVTPHTGVVLDESGEFVVNGYVWTTGSDARTSGSTASAHAAVDVHPGHFVAGPVLARVLDDLDQHGRVRFAYLGIVPGAMGAVDTKRGVRLDTVLDDSPAKGVGLMKGDLLVSIDGHPCRDPGTIGRLLVQMKPGATVTLDIARLDDPVAVVLGDRGEARQAQVAPADLGLSVVALDDSLRAYIDVAEDVVGVVVTDVVPNSAAARAGLRRGDVISHGGGGPVRDVPELEAVVATATEAIHLRVRRGKGAEFVVTLGLPQVQGRKAR